MKRVASRGHAEPELASFEQSLHDLEKIVLELETGNLSLSDSLERYEKGIRNLKSCHQILEHAENRIRILTGLHRDGTAETAEFDSQKTEIHTRSSKRGARSGGEPPTVVEYEEDESEYEDEEEDDSSGPADSLF